MGNIAIIPARGGSKRIPRKNIKQFLGKPIIEYAIEAAIGSNLFEEVMVSTDDKEIAEVSLRSGAKIPFMRTLGNACDLATTTAVLAEVLNRYKQEGKAFEYACCIYPTAVFSSPKLLQSCFTMLQEKSFDALFPVVRFSYPVWRGLRKDEHNGIKLWWPENENRRSQDLPTMYHDAGQFYWFNCEQFQQSGTLFTNNTGSIEISELECQDIDNKTDWKLAELKYQILQDKAL